MRLLAIFLSFIFVLNFSAYAGDPREIELKVKPISIPFPVVQCVLKSDEVKVLVFLNVLDRAFYERKGPSYTMGTLIQSAGDQSSRPMPISGTIEYIAESKSYQIFIAHAMGYFRGLIPAGEEKSATLEWLFIGGGQKRTLQCDSIPSDELEDQ